MLWLTKIKRLRKYVTEFLVLRKSHLFDAKYYQEANPTVKGNPLWHYIRYGWRKGYNPSKNFNTNTILLGIQMFGCQG